MSPPPTRRRLQVKTNLFVVWQIPLVINLQTLSKLIADSISCLSQSTRRKTKTIWIFFWFLCNLVANVEKYSCPLPASFFRLWGDGGPVRLGRQDHQADLHQEGTERHWYKPKITVTLTSIALTQRMSSCRSTPFSWFSCSWQWQLLVSSHFGNYSCFSVACLYHYLEVKFLFLSLWFNHPFHFCLCSAPVRFFIQTHPGLYMAS